VLLPLANAARTAVFAKKNAGTLYLPKSKFSYINKPYPTKINGHHPK
jgi:hypothetical protein